MKRILAVATALLIGVVSACSDVPVTAPVASVSEMKPKAFAVCAFGEWQGDGSCSGHEEWCQDATPASGAFCYQGVALCGLLGCDGGGSYGGGGPIERFGELTSEADYEAPEEIGPGPDRVNAYGYVLRTTLVASNFRLDFTDQRDVIHIWTLNWGSFFRLPKVAYDRENQGWDARYALVEFGIAHPNRPGETLLWANNIPSKVKYQHLGGDEYVGSITQIGKISGKCICYLGTW